MNLNDLPAKLRTTANIQLKLEEAARSLRAAQQITVEDAALFTDDEHFLAKLADVHEQARQVEKAIYGHVAVHLTEESRQLVGE